MTTSTSTTTQATLTILREALARVYDDPNPMLTIHAMDMRAARLRHIIYRFMAEGGE